MAKGIYTKNVWLILLLVLGEGFVSLEDFSVLRKITYGNMAEFIKKCLTMQKLETKDNPTYVPMHGVKCVYPLSFLQYHMD